MIIATWLRNNVLRNGKIESNIKKVQLEGGRGPVCWNQILSLAKQRPTLKEAEALLCKIKALFDKKDILCLIV